MGGVMTEDEKAELAGVYERAAEVILEKGWRQGIPGVGVTYCAGAAIEKVGGVQTQTALDFFSSALELPQSGVFGVIYWNDYPGRTVDEVINTLHALANKLR